MALPTELKRKAAMDIVLAEERARNWCPSLPGSWRKEKEYGCDILSLPPGETEPHRIEVKAWGAPIFTRKGVFTWGQDLRASQHRAACAHETYRVEIVANLDRYLAGEEGYERLTLDAELIRARAMPSLYDIALNGLEEQVRRSDAGTLAPGEAAQGSQFAREASSGLTVGSAAGGPARPTGAAGPPATWSPSGVPR